MRPVGVVHWCQPGLGWVTVQPGHLLDLMAASAAGAGVARVGPAALVIRDGVLEVRLAGGAGAGRERALVIADLDQAAEPVARLVGAGLVAVVAGVGGHDVEPHGQFPAAGQGECPGAWYPSVPSSGGFPGGELPSRLAARRIAAGPPGLPAGAGGSR